MESSGWSAYPGAATPPAKLPPVQPGRVVGIGAICDLGPERPDDPRCRSFSVSEFVTLEDGRRVILHAERGFTVGYRSTGGADPGDTARDTVESITRHILTVVLPDDDEYEEAHPWSWLADKAGARGLNVTADDLRRLPYEVVLTDEVRQTFAEGPPGDAFRSSTAPDRFTSRRRDVPGTGR